MTKEDLEIKKFELEQRIKLEELDLRKKELELKFQEQRAKKIFTPLVITIVGGLVTLITGIVVQYYENREMGRLEDKKFQSSLLLKATEASNYDEFAEMLRIFTAQGFLNLDTNYLRDFRERRFVAEALKKGPEVPVGVADTTVSIVEKPVTLTNKQMAAILKKYGDQVQQLKTPDYSSYWTIIHETGNRVAANEERVRLLNKGFKDARIYFRSNFYGIYVGRFPSYEKSLQTLFELKEMNKHGNYTAVRMDEWWCVNPKFDKEKAAYVCPAGAM